MDVVHMGKSLAFADCRPESVPFVENELSAWWIRLKAVLLDEIMRCAAQGCDTFYCGAAYGSDIIFGEQVLLVKATTDPSLRLVCVIPRGVRTGDWTQRWRDRQTSLLKRANGVMLVSLSCTRDDGHRHNRPIVDRADALLAVCGASARAITYALGQGKAVVRIDPHTLERTLESPR